MIIFVGLSLIYAVEIPTRLLSWSPGACLVGFLQFCQRSLAYVLHLRHHCGLGTRRQSLGVG
jgi:hypothetical protein